MVKTTTILGEHFSQPLHQKRLVISDIFMELYYLEDEKYTECSQRHSCHQGIQFGKKIITFHEK